MLLRRDSRKRLEPVCVVCRTVFNRPVLHRLCNDIGCRHGKLAAMVHYPLYFQKHLSGKPLFHLFDGKDFLSENFFHI